MTRQNSSLSLSLNDISILNRVKETYLIWISIIPHISRTARFTIAARIENKLLDLVELSYLTYFSEKNKKAIKITECILLLDTIKFLVTLAWQGKLISNKHFEEIAVKLDEVGKMFGGWKRKMNTS